MAPSVVFTTRRALQLLDTILTCEAQLAINLMDVQGVPALGRGTREAYERVKASWSELPPPTGLRQTWSKPRAPRCARRCTSWGQARNARA